MKHETFFRMLSEQEILLDGLQGTTPKPSLEIRDMGHPTGRGVVALEAIEKGRFVCEYKTSQVYPANSQQARDMEEEYAVNGEGSYVFTTASVVSKVNARLCFDATRRFRHPGRYINHAARGVNLKPCGPVFVKEKWRMGFIALRDIPRGEELCYDYGVREESWMRRSRLEKGKVASCAEVEGKDDEVMEVVGGNGKGKKAKRRYIWCPMRGCPSGPVQKITQHLRKVHKVSSPGEIKRLTKHKRYAPPEAIKFRIPNPHTQGSAVRPLPVIQKSRPAFPKTSKGGHTGCHRGGEFLENFSAHLSAPGGNRGESAAKQIVTNVGKYLYFLSPMAVKVEGLLLHEKVMSYIKSTEEQGVGCSGVLHRIDAHSLAVRYLLLTVENDEVLRKGERMLNFLAQVRKSYKKEKRRKQRSNVEVRALREDDELQSVQSFLEDDSVSTAFFSTAKMLLERGRVYGKKAYNCCLGIICARLMYT